MCVHDVNAAVLFPSLDLLGQGVPVCGLVAVGGAQRWDYYVEAKEDEEKRNSEKLESCGYSLAFQLNQHDKGNVPVAKREAPDRDTERDVTEGAENVTRTHQVSDLLDEPHGHIRKIDLRRDQRRGLLLQNCGSDAADGAYGAGL